MPISQKQGKNIPVKPYNMAILDDDSAEINMYGEVVSIVPKDWYTGERIPGYIGLDEFLEDLNAIKDKNKVTVHINSGGGDLYAGLAIYNRLKNFKGEVTTINDGLAASAASLIFQAGDIRRMNAGSNLMAHGVAGFLFGYYNIDDLKELVTEFKAHNKAIINVYAEAMGVDYEEAAKFVQGETWLTGAEAVEKGLADEVAEDEAEEGDGGFMNRLAAKLRPAAQAQGIIPAIPAAVPPIADTTQSIETEGDEEMEIKTVDELRNAFPELVAQIESAATENATSAAIKAERARIQGIESIENTIADKALVNSAKFGETPLTAEQLALKSLQAQAQIGATMLNNLEADAEDSGASDVEAAPNDGVEEQEPKEDVEAEAKEVVNIFKKFKGGKK